jgi:sarcosine oxidase gamma subunit
MRGKNEIYINQATMQEALQLWLDAQFKIAPKVTSVSRNRNVTGAGPDQFVVTVEGADTKL